MSAAWRDVGLRRSEIHEVSESSPEIMQHCVLLALLDNEPEFVAELERLGHRGRDASARRGPLARAVVSVPRDGKSDRHGSRDLASDDQRTRRLTPVEGPRHGAGELVSTN